MFLIAAKLGHDIEAAPCHPAGQDTVQMEVLEGQLTWLVHIIAAVVKCRLSSSTAESQETIDGDLAARAFGLLQIVDSGYDACDAAQDYAFRAHACRQDSVCAASIVATLGLRTPVMQVSCYSV